MSQVVAGREDVELVFRLERFSWDEEVVVYGHDDSTEVSRTVISAEELDDVPASLGDPLRALQSLPQVARPSHLEGALVVRGAEAINTAAYIDEVPVPYLYHFLVARSVVNPALSVGLFVRKPHKVSPRSDEINVNLATAEWTQWCGYYPPATWTLEHWGEELDTGWP